MAPPEVVSRKPFPLVPAFKERPILFSAPMVRALLDGRKTQTRRVVKWRGLEPGLNLNFSGLSVERSGSNFVLSSPRRSSHEYRSVPQPCPSGQPGDRLWVREAIRLVPDQEPDDGTGRVLSTYGADGTLTVADAWPWKRSYLPPMHCPRGLSRIDLEITGVRVERLQDISREDAKAEGCSHDDPCDHVRLSCAEIGCTGPDYRVGYRRLWEQINGPGSWDANPWVWVVLFKRVAT